jgi:hypothetical protein
MNVEKAQTAFHFYCKSERDRVATDIDRTANRGEMDVLAVNKALSDEWNALTERGQEPFNALAADDVVRYEEDLERYNIGKRFR